MAKVVYSTSTTFLSSFAHLICQSIFFVDQIKNLRQGLLISSIIAACQTLYLLNGSTLFNNNHNTDLAFSNKVEGTLAN